MALHPTLRLISRNLPSVARSLGFQARITSGYRSPKKQAWLYQRYLAGLQQYPVAPPGTSDHETGLAIDVVSTNTEKLVALLRSAGLSWAGPDDPVHFSLKARPGASRTAFQAYREDVGYKIPAALSFLPFVGGIFEAARDPEAYRDKQESKLLDVILGFL